MSKDKDLRREFQNWNKIRSTEFSQKNDFWTPKEVFDALNERFGPFEVDLAASDENHLVEPYFTKADNALQIEWNNVVGEVLVRDDCESTLVVDEGDAV